MGGPCIGGKNAGGQGYVLLQGESRAAPIHSVAYITGGVLILVKFLPMTSSPASSAIITWTYPFTTNDNQLQKSLIQCKPDISRLVGSKQWYRDISESAIYRATVMSPNQAPFTSALWAIMGLFPCLAVNSARRQQISCHLSKFDVAVQTAL